MTRHGFYKLTRYTQCQGRGKLQPRGLSIAAAPRTICLNAAGPSPLVWLACLVAGMYAVSAGALITWLALSPLQMRTERYSSNMVKSFLPSLFQPSSREAFIRQLNFEHRRELNTQISYVAQKITTVGRLETSEANTLARAIVLESRNQNIDPLFVAAVIKKESTFKNHATSHRGATGLMQLMPATGKHLSENAGLEWDGQTTLRDPSVNLRLGITYLKQLKASFRGNAEHALIAYNWGPSNLSRALRTRGHIPTSTVKYARGVLKDHQSWSSDFRSQITQYRYINLGSSVG